jgi:AcrR family transcriptional regulator
MQLVREEAILDAVNGLLADKGYDLMTVDEVAAAAGVAKASLYKHFPSKETLAAAAMVRVMDRALALLDRLGADPALDATGRLREVVRWALQTQYDGHMPSLPSQNSALRSVLAGDRDYIDRLMRMSDTLGEWITQAQADGRINPSLPPELVLFTLYGKACDPVLGVMKSTGAWSAQQIIDAMLAACFDGLSGGAARTRPRRVK